MKTSKRLPLDQLEAGMMLAQDVCDASGGRLLAEGAELSDATIASLGRRGVEHVMIAFEETLSPEQIAARASQIRTRLEYLFRQAGNDPMLLKLRATLLQYRLAGLE
jgi:mono/diheme cytochrome c family protein